jgi:2-haloacid dehalogenase
LEARRVAGETSRLPQTSSTGPLRGRALTRWASFDCYGTLIDWNAGIRSELERLFGRDAAPRLLERYHELEPQLEREEPSRSYREVLRLALERLAADENVRLPDEERDALGDSLPSWKPFPEVPRALAAARARGWKLAILSNTDPDFLAASCEQIGVPFELSIVASEIGSYKPEHRHWQRFLEQSGADRARYVHVAASLFHDIAPANELGLTSIWVNRLRERPVAQQPTREISDLEPLPDVLDELVPAPEKEMI